MMDFKFDNSFANELGDFGLPAQALIPSDPHLIIFNKALAKSLGLDSEKLEKQAVDLLSGKTLPLGSSPIAQAYAGHQFGHFSPQLGDGRALLLGEIITPQKRRYDIGFKGSGPTPFARGGDGKAPLAPMLREYLVSEAMAALGIPTTRSLAVVSTGENVWRNESLPAAILTRVAASHLRVGTFEFFASRQSLPHIERLIDYSLKRHYPKSLVTKENKALVLFDCVCQAQSQLIAKWMGVGFIHGVMNTDNMTISGETIDYGPCAFMDSYNPDTVFSSIDRKGRYAYSNQPLILKWNLARLGESLLPFFDSDPRKSEDILLKRLDQIDGLYKNEWLKIMKQKLGLSHIKDSKAEAMIFEWLRIMESQKLDWTQSFRQLTNISLSLSQGLENTSLDINPELQQWMRQWSLYLISSSSVEMKKINPIVIPRNHLVEEALEMASKGADLDLFDSLLEAVTHPFDFPKDQRMASPDPNAKPHVTYCGT